jgi:hypothetical protein
MIMATAMFFAMLMFVGAANENIGRWKQGERFEPLQKR